MAVVVETRPGIKQYRGHDQQQEKFDWREQ
jgi:hypothetical protein